MLSINQSNRMVVGLRYSTLDKALFVIEKIYHIQPNYCTVNSGFSLLLGKLVVKYVSTYTKGTLKKTSAKDLPNDSYVMFLWVFFFCFIFYYYSDFLYKAYIVGTHLNCINKLMQFKWVPTTYAFIKK